jgi:hypothetical protein
LEGLLNRIAGRAIVIGVVIVLMIVVSSILFEYTGVNGAIALAAFACGALAIRALRRFGDFLMRGRKDNR